MANLKTVEATTDWDPEKFRELEPMDDEVSYREEIPIGGLDAFEDQPPVDGNAAYGACRHAVADDDDCVDCRTNGCSGGSDCECRSATGTQRKLLDVA